MCGEHRSIVGIGVACQGSSPHVRGARKDSPLRRCHSGIIPACAGSTRCILITMWNRWDHPRMCGEHDFQPFVISFGLGSSPHVRGARFPNGGRVPLAGIIPACAGSTIPARTTPKLRWDHPRMCGEHPIAWIVRPFVVGSSPHVRGAPKYDLATSIMTGIIPACAGSTSPLVLQPDVSRDHPRMCGEHSMLMVELFDA